MVNSLTTPAFTHFLQISVFSQDSVGRSLLRPKTALAQYPNESTEVVSKGVGVVLPVREKGEIQMTDHRKNSGLDRRELLHVMGGAIGGVALEALSGRHASAEGKASRAHRRRLPRKPNFLILMCDEERFPPAYENDEIKKWREANLLTQELFTA